MKMFGLEFLFDSFVVKSLIGLFVVLLLYWFSTRNHDYWEKKNVPYVKPLPLLGSILDNLRKPLHEVEYERQLKLGPVFGYYEGSYANISVGDPALLRDILVKDFASFPNRRPFEFGDKVIDNSIGVKRGEDWKRVRSIITPTFSTGKIRRMLSIINECAETLVSNFKALVKEGKPIEVKRIYGAYSMDVIASSAFSTKLDSHNDPDNRFVQVAKNVFNQKPGLKFFLFFLCPWVLKLFKMQVFAGEASQFFKDITLRIIEERKKTGQVRNDFLQLLMDIAKETETEENKQDTAEKEKEDIASNYGENDAGHHIFKTTTSKKLSTDELVAQCVIFFIAGYDTTATTLTMATYFLALHQDIQDKVRAEVDSLLKEHNGKLTYEAVQSMKYLDNVISETLRIYPISVRLERRAEEDYKLGDTGITIPKGMIVSIPVIAVHRDPKYWPDPEKFDPDRFTPEQRAQRDPYSYLPFGAGPRNCLGMRFALMEVKVCLAHVIANFTIKTCPQTKIPLEFDLGSQGLIQPIGIIVKMEPRQESLLLK
ncbi:cytochrome P450 3A8-like [Argiope bruennichi]|uniref:cytochrome P450 3A8-like n=1 Tax=Argiope bruennichi TaxID=94029 RepID=UPI002495485C|nr:cytochrome P450 3A8-like [Argiope bruennichi]